MTDLTDHSGDGVIIIFLNRTIDLAQAKRLNGALLSFGTADGTSNLRNANF